MAKVSANYEVVYIIDPAQGEEGIAALVANFKSLAEQYQLEVDKVKEMVPMDELTGSIKTRKAVKTIVDNAVAVAPKAEEKAEEETEA